MIIIGGFDMTIYLLTEGDGKRIAESENINDVLTPENLGIQKNLLGRLVDSVKLI